MSLRSSRFTSRSSRRIVSMSPRNFSISWRSLSVSTRFSPSPCFSSPASCCCTSFSLAVSACSLSRKRCSASRRRSLTSSNGRSLTPRPRERDQRIGARQVLERTQHERAVVGSWGSPPAGRGTRARRPRTGRAGSRVSATITTLILPEATCGLRRRRLGLGLGSLGSGGVGLLVGGLGRRIVLLVRRLGGRASWPPCRPLLSAALSLAGSLVSALRLRVRRLAEAAHRRTRSWPRPRRAPPASAACRRACSCAADPPRPASC